MRTFIAGVMSVVSLAVLAEVPSITPVPANADPKGNWMARFERQKSTARKLGPEIDVVFLGDSITQGWEGKGVQVWRKYFEGGPYSSLNLGMSGDRTEHVLWRIDHGALDGFQTKSVVLMIGTNNTGHRAREKESPIDTLLGIWEVIGRIRLKQPKARIILTAILPRGRDANDPLRRRNDEVNRQIRTLANGRDIVFCDFTRQLLTADGVLPCEIAPDFLHPANYGYEIWANAVLPMINDALDRCADRLAPSRYAGFLLPGEAFSDGPLEEQPFLDRIGYRGAGSPQDWYVKKLLSNRREIDSAGGEFDVVFVGDSITHGWDGRGAEALAELRKTYRILNLGYSGDGTQHVLWRLANGQLEGYRTKLFMLMIGTNNGGKDECVGGVRKIVSLMRTMHPESRILLLPIFPFKPSPADPERIRRVRTSERYRKEIADGTKVLWHDFNARLLQPDGTYAAAMAPDFLHPGPEGYRIWKEEVEPIFRKVCQR